MSYIEFIKESFSNLRTVGTFTRSSKYVSEKMVKQAALGDSRIIVELGAGDGAITKHILKKMHPKARLFAFELNTKFAARLRMIKDDRLIVIDQDVAKIQSILQKHGVEEVDHIISAIPFVAFPEEKSIQIIEACKSVLKKGGRFIQIHYSLFLKKMYESLFSEVSVGFVMRNVPPAWIFTCYI